jgi:REP element-mobilizing transposase RayT
MPSARKSLISLKETPYYHCIARCVRRAWLWGVDEYAGKDYSHRKEWVIERLRELSKAFAIEVCAYAVLSNHYHTVLYVDVERCKQWEDAEVVRRWGKLFSIPTLVQRYLDQESESQAAAAEAKRIVKEWRSRLMEVSWYMRCLNEHLARKANIEDNVTGRFWEGRFKSQALLDEAGLLTAMAYVDLNPIRAGIAKTPETSEFTSIYERIRTLKNKSINGMKLKRFKDQTKSDNAIPCTQTDYLALIDWTGRAIRPDKRGHIDQTLPPILKRLNIDSDAWQAMMQPEGNLFGRAIGPVNHLLLHAKALGQQWVKGLRQAERIYRTT